MLKTRVFSSVIILPIVIAVIFLGGVYYTLMLAFVAALMGWELANMLDNKSLLERNIAAIIGALTPLIFFFIEADMAVSWAAGSVILCFVFLFKKKTFSELILILLTYLLAQSAILALAWLRVYPEDGVLSVAYTVFVIAGADIGGYFVGRMLGGPKLAPKISPNKTWAGLIGGTISAGMVSYGFSFVGNPIFLIETGIESDTSSFFYLLILGFVIGPVSQAGDLLESWIKRSNSVKDSGNIIPGHGGILDRVDGYLTVAPLVALMTILCKGEGVV